MKQLSRILILSAIVGFHAGAEEAAPTKTQDSRFVELQPEDFKPAFTRETVIKLNAIVHRSYDVINQYDAIIGEVRKTVANKEKMQALAPEHKMKIEMIAMLATQSQKALADMTAAVTALEESSEHYNPAVLAGMVDFVKDVEQEITEQHSKMLKM